MNEQLLYYMTLIEQEVTLSQSVTLHSLPLYEL